MNLLQRDDFICGPGTALCAACVSCAVEVYSFCSPCTQWRMFLRLERSQQRSLNDPLLYGTNLVSQATCGVRQATWAMRDLGAHLHIVHRDPAFATEIDERRAVEVVVECGPERYREGGGGG